MAFVRVANALVLLQLSLLLSSNVNTDATSYSPAPSPSHGGHHHKHPPVPAPAPAPTRPPVSPPAHPPVKPPTPAPTRPPVSPPAHPPVKPPTPSYPPQIRKKVGVQGVVYCKSCKYRGINTLMGATPLTGAVVRLQCNNTKKGLNETQVTDKNGYFFFMPQALTTSGAHKCKVTLVSSPSAKCNVPTNLHAGAVGAILMPRSVTVPNPKLQVFTVGPFAFEPSKRVPCY